MKHRPMLRPRRNKIIEYLEAKGEMTVVELAELLRATPMTIRTDLAALEEQGRLIRHHGGAVAVEKKTIFPVASKEVIRQREKEKIAFRALGMIEPDNLLLLDTGSTVVEVAKIVSRVEPVTVITCSLFVLSELYSKPRVTVTLLGGDVSRNECVLYGPVTEQNFSHITADIAIMGADGITEKGGFGSNSLVGARIPELMIKSARKKVVVADKTKLGKNAKISYAQPKDIDVLITTAAEDDETVCFLKTQGVEVIHV